VYRHNGFDPRRQPPYPEGFSGRYMMYHWFAQVHGWTPRQVDELGLGELFWLPVMKEASDLAAEQIRERS